jgi:hypothetical protein
VGSSSGSCYFRGELGMRKSSQSYVHMQIDRGVQGLHRLSCVSLGQRSTEQVRCEILVILRTL